MKPHGLFLGFLLSMGLLVPVALGLRGCGYYSTPVSERPFHPQYEVLKPSGFESHGYGVIGTLLIIVGVTSYSSRKRLRLLRTAGSLRTFLEVHIFLCLVGPTLVLFHTTFKFGGLVAVSAWSMMAVVLSGIVGRYLYTQIPKTIRGQEMTLEEITRERDRLTTGLLQHTGMSTEDLEHLDALLAPEGSAPPAGAIQTLQRALTFDLRSRTRLGIFRRELGRRKIPSHIVRQLERVALRRAVLRRRMTVLEQSRRLFHLWHVIHLPFTIVMFVILLIHITVAFLFGYWWIW